MIQRRLPLDTSEPITDPWRILIVDDEPTFRASFALAVRDVVIDSRGVEVVQADSAAAAIELLKSVSDGYFALAVIDVAMEEAHSGLEVIRTLRDDLNFYSTQVVICTGNPGFAPPLSIASELEINDYRVKSQLRRNDIVCLVYTGIRAFKLLKRIESHSKRLQDAANAIAAVAGLSDQRRTAQESADQLLSIASLDCVEVLVRRRSQALVVLASARAQNIDDLSQHRLQEIKAEVEKSPRNSEDQFHRCIYQTTAGLEIVLLAIGKHIDPLQGELITAFAHSAFAAIWGAFVAERAHSHQKLAAIGQYAGALAHDIKNAQTILKASSERLQRMSDQGESPTREMLIQLVQLIEGASERIDSGLRGALSSRTIAGDQTPTDVRAVVDEVVDAMQAKLQRIDVTVCDSLNGRVVRFNEEQLYRVVENLLTNATQALAKTKSTRQPTIVIQAFQVDPATHTVEVRDNGPGISLEDQENVFEPFFSTNHSKHRGLGLAICDAIITQAGGEIRVDSQVDQGTSFSVKLPAACNPPEKCTCKTSLLIVDPEISRGYELARQLDQSRSTPVKSVDDAIRFAQQCPELCKIWVQYSIGSPEIRRLVETCRQAAEGELQVSLLSSSPNSPAVKNIAAELNLVIVALPFHWQAPQAGAELLR